MKASRGYASRLRKQPRAKVDHPRDSVVSLNLNESRDPWDKSGTFTYMISHESMVNVDTYSGPMDFMGCGKCHVKRLSPNFRFI